MPIVVLRLHPEEPTDGDTFQTYLEGMVITVRDRSFSDPKGVTNVLGTARYLTEGDPDATIVQHRDLFFWYRTPAATAAVDLTSPLGFDEFDNPDLTIEITRTGEPDPVLYKRVNFNVALAAGSLPATSNPITYAALAPVALYIPIPATLPASAGSAFVDIPDDGTPPAFDALVAAANAVLAADPGAPAVDLATLTPDQCRHIAHEIVFNRAIDPIPEPPRPIEQLYDGSSEQQRQQFEAALQTYYTLHSTRVGVLATYLYSMAAAFACAKTSEDATQVGFTFPIRPGLSTTSEKVGEATVIVSQ